MTLLAIDDLNVCFATRRGALPAVRGVSLRLGAGECLGVVGESGAGKSQLFLAAFGLRPANCQVTGSVRYAGQDLLRIGSGALDRLRGTSIGFVFQDPLAALTPHLRIGDQLAEGLILHEGRTRRDALAAARRMLERVRLPEAARRLRSYPHELSGGQRQRVMIALALMMRPRLVIADEPTTALDVTVQADILDLFAELKRELGLALVLISHDLGVIATLTDRLTVLYAGQVVEQGTTAAVFAEPAHPYTAALLAALPRLDDPVDAPARFIPGNPPDPQALPEGCTFAPRCPRTQELCRRAPTLRRHSPGGDVACHVPLEVADT